MSCECINKIEEKIRAKTGDNMADVRSNFMLPSFKRVPVIEVSFRATKKDGTLAMRQSHQSLICKFCPFCGLILVEDLGYNIND